MSTIRLASLVCLIAVACALDANPRAQDQYGDADVILQFQRSLDAYAFQHRQVQRRTVEGADQQAMAAALRAARPAAAEGDFFTPLVAVSFRARIAAAFRTQGCSLGPLRTAGSEVPRVGPLTIATGAVPSCVLGVLPRLPEELEYRTASVALLLLDTHANLVVDVLHGAFPTP
jgi:hypothetical protein